VDLSEGGLRARFVGTEVAVGDQVVVTLTLDGETIDAPGRIQRAQPDPDARGVNVVVLFELAERQAQPVRRYVMRHQMATRNGVRA